MMKGTIKRNNVLQPMMSYGCHSDKPTERVVRGLVRHGNGSPKNEAWPHYMSRKCRYDNKFKDERCEGCQVDYDQEYVDALK